MTPEPQFRYFKAQDADRPHYRANETRVECCAFGKWAHQTGFTLADILALPGYVETTATGTALAETPDAGSGGVLVRGDSGARPDSPFHISKEAPATPGAGGAGDVPPNFKRSGSGFCECSGQWVCDYCEHFKPTEPGESRTPTLAQAKEAADALIAHYWDNKHRPVRASIPARPDYDDDLVLSAYLAGKDKELADARAEVEKYRKRAEHHEILEAALGHLAPAGTWFRDDVLTPLWNATTRDVAITIAKATQRQIDKNGLWVGDREAEQTAESLQAENARLKTLADGLRDALVRIEEIAYNTDSNTDWSAVITEIHSIASKEALSPAGGGEGGFITVTVERSRWEMFEAMMSPPPPCSECGTYHDRMSNCVPTPARP